eukprot:scaffold30434_cov29-Tisochrysis_lutea.AAC.4
MGARRVHVVLPGADAYSGVDRRRHEAEAVGQLEPPARLLEAPPASSRFADAPVRPLRPFVPPSRLRSSAAPSRTG